MFVLPKKKLMTMSKNTYLILINFSSHIMIVIDDH